MGKDEALRGTIVCRGPEVLERGSDHLATARVVAGHCTLWDLLTIE